MATQEKRCRKANWTPDETLHLAQLYSEHAKVLRSSFSLSGCSKQSRSAAWSNISQRVTEMSGIPRTEKECQKRWQTIQSEARAKVAKQRRAMDGTGGGPPAPPLSQLEDLIIEIMGYNNVSILGCSDEEDIITYTYFSKSTGTVDEEEVAGDEGTAGTEEDGVAVAAAPLHSVTPPAQQPQEASATSQISEAPPSIVFLDEAEATHQEKKRKLELKALEESINASGVKAEYYRYKLDLLKNSHI